MSLYIRSTHPFAYRTGQWGQVQEVKLYTPPQRVLERLVFVVRFPDGDEDLWPVYDEDKTYEFSEETGKWYQ